MSSSSWVSLLETEPSSSTNDIFAKLRTYPPSFTPWPTYDKGWEKGGDVCYASHSARKGRGTRTCIQSITNPDRSNSKYVQFLVPCHCFLVEIMVLFLLKCCNSLFTDLPASVHLPCSLFSAQQPEILLKCKPYQQQSSDQNPPVALRLLSIQAQILDNSLRACLIQSLISFPTIRPLLSTSFDPH